MKNVYIRATLLVSLMSVVLLAACNDENGNDSGAGALSVTPPALAFAADDPQAKVVEVTTDANFWLVEKSDDWVKHSKTGNELFISVLNHEGTTEERTATVTVITGEGRSADITVTQEAKQANTFSISPTSLSYDANEIGDRTVTITTDAESWDAVTDASWITLLKQDQTLKVSISEENTKSTPLTGNIIMTAGNAPEIILPVTHSAVMFLSAEPAVLSYKATETGEKVVDILTNAISWNAITDVPWVKLIKQNNMLKVIVNEANTQYSPREAKVKITADKAPDFILPVTQVADIFLSVDPVALSFRAYDTEKQITVSTNAADWNATTEENSWIKITKQNDVLRVVADRNDSRLDRDTEIKITAGENVIVTIPVTQAK